MTEEQKPLWRPLSAIDRRVLGVMGEKAKTTPDAYPMSLNAIRSGCNQKSNRDPVMELEESDIEDSLDRLRQAGAAAVVQGGGRVLRYRHYLYEWLGTKDKYEVSVMIELLLRGAQTEGELRGRASRMDTIADLTAMRNIINSLKKQGLMISLTPEGRGHVVTHTLYLPKEMDRLKQEHATSSTPQPAAVAQPAPTASSPPPSTSAPVPVIQASAPAGVSSPLTEEVSELRREMRELRSKFDQHRHDFQELLNRFDQTTSDLQRLKDALGD